MYQDTIQAAATNKKWRKAQCRSWTYRLQQSASNCLKWSQQQVYWYCYVKILYYKFVACTWDVDLPTCHIFSSALQKCKQLEGSPLGKVRKCLNFYIVVVLLLQRISNFNQEQNTKCYCADICIIAETGVRTKAYKIFLWSSHPISRRTRK